MWDFLRAHWWIATTIPYFAFNAWLVNVFARDESDFLEDEVTIRVYLYLAGLPIIIICLLWSIASCLSLAHAKSVAKYSVITLVVASVYIVLTALAHHQPSRAVSIAEILGLSFLASYVFYLGRKS